MNQTQATTTISWKPTVESRKKPMTAVMQLINFILVERRQEDGSIKFHAHEDLITRMNMLKHFTTKPTTKLITMEQCKCCEREKELRLGYCFDCANAESVIVEGVDMYDNEITKEEGMPMSMSKLKWVLKKFNVVNNK